MTRTARKRRSYILTETAERDFRLARQWSMRRWGKELTKQYFLDLHDCAENLARSPRQPQPSKRRNASRTAPRASRGGTNNRECHNPGGFKMAPPGRHTPSIVQ